MRPEFHAVRDSARRFREVAKARADIYPKALTPSGIEAAWRQYAKDDPRIVPFREEFIRVASGEGEANG